MIVVAESGARFPADLVILAIGVRPETELARAAGLQIGSRGGIVVDAQMRTSDAQIWAVGDEKGLRRAGMTSFEKVYLHPGHHAGYYPGARPRTC